MRERERRREREREITKTEKKLMQFKEDEQKEAINSTEQEVGIAKTSKNRVLMVIPLSWCPRALIKKRDRPSQCFKHW